MVLKIIFCIAGILIVVFGIWSNMKYEEECRKRSEELKAMWERKLYPEWRLSQYLDHIEKANLEIMEARTPTDMTITLWLGLDGLRINEDGTYEWVSRRKEKAESAEGTQLQTPISQSLKNQIAAIQLAQLQAMTSPLYPRYMTPPYAPVYSTQQCCCSAGSMIGGSMCNYGGIWQ